MWGATLRRHVSTAAVMLADSLSSPPSPTGRPVVLVVSAKAHGTKHSTPPSKQDTNLSHGACVLTDL